MTATGLGDTPPADTTALWLSTSHKDMRVSNSPQDRKTIITPTLAAEGVVVQEPSVFFYNGLWWMFYTGGNSAAQYAFLASALNPQGPWKKYGQVLGNSVGGQTGQTFHSNVYIEGATGYLYYPDPSNSGKFACSSFPLSSLPAPTFTQLGDVYTAPSNATGLLGNSFVFKRGTNDYVMLVEIPFNNYQIGLAYSTSPAGPFVHEAVPLRTLYPPVSYLQNAVALAAQNGGPVLYRDPDGIFCLYFHAGPTGRPTDGYRAFSSDLVNWTPDNNGLPFIRRVANAEVDQVADLDVVASPGGPFACFWSQMENTPSLIGSIAYAPMLPVFKWFDGNQWVVANYPATDTTPPKSQLISSAVPAAGFITSTVGSDVTVTGLALATFVPDFNCRATIKMSIKVASTAAGSVLAKINVPTATVVNSAPYVTYPTKSQQCDTMPAAVATTVASGSNSVNTSTFAGAGILSVASVTNLLQSGMVLVATAGTTALITYTGISGSTLTGCTTISGGGVMSTGGAVQGLFFVSMLVETTVNLIAGTAYTINGSVNNNALSAQTVAYPGGQYSEIELVAVVN